MAERAVERVVSSLQRMAVSNNEKHVRNRTETTGQGRTLTFGRSYGLGEGGDRALFALPLAAERGVQNEGDRISASMLEILHFQQAYFCR